MSKKDKTNILLVDDNPKNLLGLEAILESPDRNILTAASGNDALALLMQHDFSLVLLDVMMPEIDGFEVAEIMKRSEKTKHIPIIFITAISKNKKDISKVQKLFVNSLKKDLQKKGDY